MKTFTLFWLTGKSEIIKGTSISNAFTSAGYGGGASRVLDFYSKGDNKKKWNWDKNNKKWIK